jgi:hypothetical protein
MKAVFDALLPDGSFWHYKPGGDFDKLISGMGDNAQAMFEFLGAIANQRDPYLTNMLSDLELEYGLLTDERLTEQDRRDQVAAIKFAKPGTGSYTYLQDRLIAAGFDLIVTPNDPALDPNMFLGEDFLMVANGYNAYAGYYESGTPTLAIAGYGAAAGELVVNGDLFVQTVGYLMQANGGDAFAGNEKAVAGYFLSINRTAIEYTVPEDPDRWNYIFFVGGEATGWPYQYDSMIRRLRDQKVILFYHDYLTEGYRDFGRRGNDGVENNVTLTVDGATFPLADSIITIPDNEALTPANISIVAVIETSAAAVTESIAGKYWPVATERSWLFEVNSSNKMSFTTSADGSAQTTISSNTVVNDGSFHTVGISKKGTTGTFYFDGNSDGSGTVDNVPYNNLNEVGIGASKKVDGTIGNNFSGTIKAILVVDKDLTAGEQAQLHTELIALTTPQIQRAQVLSEKREILKRMILQYKPMHSWGGLIVEYI